MKSNFRVTEFCVNQAKFIHAKIHDGRFQLYCYADFSSKKYTHSRKIPSRDNATRKLLSLLHRVSLYHKLVVLARFSSGRFFIYITALFWLVFSFAYTNSAPLAVGLLLFHPTKPKKIGFAGITVRRLHRT
jgi:hypothetical protein